MAHILRPVNEGGGGGGFRKKRNLKGLQLPGSPLLATSVESIVTSPLVLGLEFQLDLQSEDLEMIQELGHGSGGSVDKVLHIPTKTIMAKKTIRVDTQPQIKQRILRELRILHDCNSPYIVSFYGAFMHEGEICICMEYMDIGSLDTIYRKVGKIPPNVLGKITVNVLHGLIYLYDTHRIIHRDIKPSNILVNTAGLIKLCDFGVSGILINSIAKTFVGTNLYMSPERIRGGEYTVKSDVWSFGITLMELANGRFPIEEQPGGVLDLLQLIVNEPPPTLKGLEGFPEDLVSFLDTCLTKDPSQRPTPSQLVTHPYVISCEAIKVDLADWAAKLKK